MEGGQVESIDLSDLSQQASGSRFYQSKTPREDGVVIIGPEELLDRNPNVRESVIRDEAEAGGFRGLEWRKGIL